MSVLLGGEKKSLEMLETLTTEVSASKIDSSMGLDSIHEEREPTPMQREKQTSSEEKDVSRVVSPFTTEQQTYIDSHLNDWKKGYEKSKKIPKSMKKWFKKERLKKGYAIKLLGQG